MWCLHMANLLQFASQSSTVAADNILIDISYDFNFNLVPLIVSLFAVFARNSLTSVSPLPQDKTGLVAFSFHCYDKCSCPLRWSVLAVVTKVDLSSSIAIVFSPDLHCVFALISPIIMLIVLFQCFCTIYISGQCCLQAGPMTLSLSRWDSEFPRCTLWLIIYLCKANRLASIVSVHRWQRSSTLLAFLFLFLFFLVLPVTAAVPSGACWMGNSLNGLSVGPIDWPCVGTAKCFAISANCSSPVSQLFWFTECALIESVMKCDFNWICSQ